MPRRHVGHIDDLSPHEFTALFVFAKAVTHLLLIKFNGDGYDWTTQNGESAGQTVPHVHLHIIPRYRGDLPDPGDWYERLNLPTVHEVKGSIDSDVRAKLTPTQMTSVVGELGKAARESNLLGPDQ